MAQVQMLPLVAESGMGRSPDFISFHLRYAV